MKKSVRRGYRSEVRQEKARQTRERILEAVGAWMKQRPQEELTFDGLAALARVERRTIFRHFPNKEELLAAFWASINHRVTPHVLPESLGDLHAAPREIFEKFDAQEGLIRASLHSSAGRDMRLGQVAARRKAFRQALRASTSGTARTTEQKYVEWIAHVLCSAAAWETMRDYAGVSGREAGAAASWALEVLTAAAGQRRGAK